ncbi:multidrug ABC transporter ATP-binding protein [Sutcliffiella horikoshii]|uniref:Multidrug ABC transporter ATP-binding protein n=1 Tax=Sutcliffiella horikoshii TaxID=79883 RepID=A0ABN4ZF77_9BACI|nr:MULTISPECIES: ABC transporter ATP-binding protein [Bacillaceae]ART77035.1 multidrug ABC transporter ATP-binding protein [Sutcliffiella horikoshii]
MKNVIEVESLSRIYKMKGEKKTALNQVNFEVREGEVFGLLGPNGAGKTTTIKILTTLLLPSTGSVKVLGYDVVKESSEIRDKINFVYGGERGVYGRLTAKEYMHYFCTLYKIPNKDQSQQISQLLELVGLTDATNQKIHTYSKGMVQRLHIARCLINDPKIIFLDEPTIGLDPIGARLLRDIVKELAQKGITIILTTHYMQEADELCDRIAFIKNGEISMIGEPTHIKESCNHLKLFEATMQVYDTDKLKEDKFLQQVEVTEIKAPYYSVMFQVEEEEARLDQLKEYLAKYGDVIKLERREISLEDAYVHHMKDVG